MSEQPRALTAAELRDEFMESCRGLADHWARPGNSPDASWPERMRGLLHSILVIFDGCSDGLPAFDITARSNSTEQEFCRDNDENWVEDGTVINTSASLHDMLYQGRWVFFKRP